MGGGGQIGGCRRALTATPCAPSWRSDIVVEIEVIVLEFAGRSDRVRSLVSSPGNAIETT
jgi:hypothetical protein